MFKSRNNEELLKVFNERISKKLTYVLKFGAEQEGLAIDNRGYVSFDDLMLLPIFSNFTRDQVLDVIISDCTSKGAFRFQQEQLSSGELFVRATGGRGDQIENGNNSVYHEGTKVKRLFQQAVEFVCDNIMWPYYPELMRYVDNFIIFEEIISRLRRTGRINNKTLSIVLVPCLNKLNFDGCLLTINSLKMIGNNCPTLRNLVLRNHPYVITDSSLKELIRNLPHLESLNVAYCHHLTDSIIDSIIQYLPNIQKINLSFVTNLTLPSLVKLISSCPNLQLLEIIGLPIDSSENEFNDLVQISHEKNIKIIYEQQPPVQFDSRSHNRNMEIAFTNANKCVNSFRYE